MAGASVSARTLRAFSSSPARGYEFIIAEKKGEKENVGLITLNR